ncbi:hypothetical protein BaRGS_00006818 [Batillaria attramentaria]|uniref:Uncharacterized protein n=1 Tax=Batillaria attramentaria TaxID=370345 RepID=A0ABD0LSD7_9CAEN
MSTTKYNNLILCGLQLSGGPVIFVAVEQEAHHDPSMGLRGLELELAVGGACAVEILYHFLQIKKHETYSFFIQNMQW